MRLVDCPRNSDCSSHQNKLDPPGGESMIQKIHLIFKTHLDVGFTDYARNVIANYFTRFIPQALTTAEELRQAGGTERFVWTTGAWLIYEYLEQAGARDRERLEKAIDAGDIAWHGLPFTTHSELLDPELFRFGLSLSAELDQRFGRHTIAAKMTDVPGHTRGIVPLLAEAGIQFLHIGVNPASTPPDVPPVFTWRSPDGSDVMVMYHKGSYGDLMTVPGLDEAIAFAHTGDNRGPQSADGIRAVFAEFHQRFPGVELAASTMDTFAACLVKVKDSLPTVHTEIGDTWIHGAGSDPGKVSQYRELLRLRKNWLVQGRLRVDSPPYRDLSRFLLLVPEHTWGMDVKIHLADYEAYSADKFRAGRGQPNFIEFASSWDEQRDYVRRAVDALGDRSLMEEARATLNALKPVRAQAGNYGPTVSPDAVFDTSYFRLGFDPATGAITNLEVKETHRRWASVESTLGLFQYETFSQSDYDRFYRQYINNKRENWSWAIPDFTKLGMETAGAEHCTWLPCLKALNYLQTKRSDRFLLQLEYSGLPVEMYGCPARVEIEIEALHTEPVLDFTVQWFDKAACRLPEAIWFSFIPRTRLSSGWKMEKLGQLISPLEVIRNGNRKLHALGSGVSYQEERTGLTIETFDAPLVAPGERSLLNFNNRQPPLRKGMHFLLYNNLWGTNFPMWYEEDARFRFYLKFRG
jgi:hypothetical protein